MASFGTQMYLFIVFICASNFIESHRLGRHHSHHSRPDDFAEESMLRDLTPKNLEKDMVHRDVYPQEKLDYFLVSDCKKALERGIHIPHWCRNVLKNHDYRRKEEQYRQYDKDIFLQEFFGTRKKRHNHHDNVNHSRQRKLITSWNSQNKQRAQQLLILHQNVLNSLYEMEVREAQNSSICNYTVIPIPDPTGTRVPKDLEHVKCNHPGSSCLNDSGTHCCIQTYKIINVSNGDGVEKSMKIYVGCVCATQILVEETTLPIND